MVLSSGVPRRGYQQWTAIVVELLIVIGGVFLGVQASNWNDTRLQKQEGRLLAERLISDLQKDLDSRQTLVSYYQAVFESAERTESRLISESIDDPEAFIIDVYRSTEYAHRPATRAAYEELISTGRLGLLPQEAREAGVIEYFRYDNSLAMRDAVRDSPYRHRVRKSIPYDIQVAIRAKCSDLYNERSEIIGFDDNCDLGIPLDRLKVAADAVYLDKEMLPELRLHFSILNATMPNFRGEVVNLEATIRALEEAR